ncbi:DNA alkylation repair protein [candidate division KSB1 bacterium]|nr:DNA alkylation repair protein [candidate division KSB1 bacterium]TDI94124.1 MAG: DNA alkylation repair protein [Caldithrix sp.]
MIVSIKEVKAHMQELSNPKIAEHSLRFFKTGPGEYGEGDVFLGIRVPVTRKVARKFRELSLDQILKLLKSKFHEERLLALFMLVALFKKGDDIEKKNIYNAYLGHTDSINNWDLVDGSAHQIVGGYLFERDRRPLYKLVKSKSLWERRISMIATYTFIKKNDFVDTLKLSEILLPDEEDLIHKAVGWMLREVGKLDLEVEEKFLQKHYKKMPRTMLRYAIEKFVEKKRQGYLQGTV